MRPSLLLLPLVTLSCARMPGGGGGFPEALTRPLQGTVTRDKTWSWPKPQDFDAAWDKRVAAGGSHRMVLGTISTVSRHASERGLAL